MHAATHQSSRLSSLYAAIGSVNGLPSNVFRTNCENKQWWKVLFSDLYHIAVVEISTPSIIKARIGNALACSNENVGTLKPELNPTYSILASSKPGSKERTNFKQYSIISNITINYELDTNGSNVLATSKTSGDISSANIFAKEIVVYNSEFQGVHLKEVKVKGNRKYDVNFSHESEYYYQR